MIHSTRRTFLATWALGAGASAFGVTPSKRWIREQIHRGNDPICGSQILQLTSAADISHDIYGEQLYCSADGKRIAFLRCATTDHRDGPMELFIADLEMQGVKRIGEAAFFLCAGNGKNDSIFYVRHNAEKQLEIVRVKYATLEQTTVFTFDECPPPEFRGLLAVSPDERYCAHLRRLGGRRYGVERIDFETGTWELIHEKDDIFNGHLQYNHDGSQLMVQHNRGGELTADYDVIRSVGPEGATLYAISAGGETERELPVGTPHTTAVTGHESWVGDTGEIILTCAGGKIYLAKPGDQKAKLIATGAGFMHISASPDGKFFVVDSTGTGRLFVGCIATKRVLPLCDSGTSTGSPQYTHTHPYITPGNHRVIFNSDRTGIPQVYAARIPEQLLAELEAE